ncbi:MAG: UvrD-helicase domain-containing protein [Paludibacteraceae bacterium]|nr:UvrD-helicase domain-containing protein [Paludibacteraceae bacterium]
MEKKSFLEELNSAQQEAVLYNEGPHLVVAGAGSGKTRVLTYKVAYLLSQGVPPSSVLALTFTNKAAREMKERIGKLVGEKEARYVWMGTFHSICARILRQEHEVIGYPHDFTIYDTPDSKSTLKQIVKDLGEDDKIYKPGDLLGIISEAKNNMIDEHEYARNKDFLERDRRQRHYRMAEIYRLYQQRLRTAAAMDFDDLLFNMNRLLENHPEVRVKYQNLFEYILVDEYQDTNYSQYLIVRRLAEPKRHICVVGDDAQSIYGFRGADIRNILMFQSQYQGCPIFKLERNYRSTQNITNAANSLIHHNRNQIRKDVYSENGEGEPVRIASYSSDRDEAAGIVQHIRKRHKAGYSYNDIAILYRTNAQSRVIEDELRSNNIPYSIYGGLSFYQRREIKDALAFFRLAVNPLDNEALNRAVGVTKGIGETTMKKIREAANEHAVSFLEVITSPDKYNLACSAATIKRIQDFAAQVAMNGQMAEQVDAYSFAEDVMNRSGVMTAAILDNIAEGQERKENLKELQAAIHEYVEQNSTESHVPTISEFLSEVALLTDQDQRLPDDAPRVNLMTIHAAKGLEFAVVFIAGLEENLFPSGFVQSEHDLEEERRLFYVAITRAKEECCISHARSRFKNGTVNIQTESRFLKELDRQYVTVHSGTETRSFSRFENFRRLWEEQPSRSAADERQSGSAITRTEEKLSKKPAACTDFKEGDRIEHNVFGPGKVLAVYHENGNDKADIIFDRSGRKTLLLKFAKLTRID